MNELPASHLSGVTVGITAAVVVVLLQIPQRQAIVAEVEEEDASIIQSNPVVKLNITGCRE